MSDLGEHPPEVVEAMARAGSRFAIDNASRDWAANDDDYLDALLSAALNTTWERSCESCGGSGFEHHLTRNPNPDDSACGDCDGRGVVTFCYREVPKEDA